MWTANKKNKAGIGLVEVIVGVAIIASAVMSSFFYFGFATKAARGSTEAIQVASLLEEGAEAMRVVRDNAWANISSLSEGLPYNFEFSENTWKATTTSAILDEKFERTFMVAPVYRDSNDDIVSFGGALDPDTKLIEVSVSWESGGEEHVESLLLYLTNSF